MSFVVGTYENGNPILWADSIVISEGCFCNNYTKYGYCENHNYSDPVYYAFAGSETECLSMIESLVETGIDFKDKKYLLIKNIVEWLNEYSGSYRTFIDGISIVILYKKRFIIIQYLTADSPYDIIIVDPKDYRKNMVSIGSGSNVYFQFVNIVKGTKWENMMNYEDIIKLITYKCTTTSFPLFKIDPSKRTITKYDSIESTGTIVDWDQNINKL